MEAWTSLLSGASGGSNATNGDKYNTTNFGNVNFGGSGGGLNLDQNSLLIAGGLIVALIVVVSK